MSQLSHPEWNKETSGLEVAKAFGDRIRGKDVLITGVSPESIGSATALSIASQSPGLLILASRTHSKLNDVLDRIKESYPNVKAEAVELDLGSQESIRSAAAQVRQLTNTLHVIINNAGLMTPRRQYTKEGIEAQFGINHIGHFLLTNLLQPQIVAASKSDTAGATRVVNLTSLGHRLSPVRFSDYNMTREDIPEDEMHAPLPPTFAKRADDGYSGFVAYGQAKTANILFSIGLNERLGKDGIRSYAVHPGSIWTGLSRDLDPDGEEAIRKTSNFWKNLDQGASTTLVAAFDPALDDQNGILLHDCQLFDAAPHATDPDKAARLWKLSEGLVREKLRL